MSECVREMTPTEKAKFIMAILERGGYNMQQWERDYLMKVLQEKIDILAYSRRQGYQPTMESINNIPPSTGSSVQYRAKILGEWVKTKGDKIRESNESLASYIEGVVAIALGDSSFIDIERRIDYLNQPYTE